MINWLKRHYYWIIIIVMMLQTSVYGGLANNLSSIFIIPVTEDVGISRSDFSMAISMRTLFIFLATTFSGTIFNRIRHRICLTIDKRILPANRFFQFLDWSWRIIHWNSRGKSHRECVVSQISGQYAWLDYSLYGFGRRYFLCSAIINYCKHRLEIRTLTVCTIFPCSRNPRRYLYLQ